LAPESRRLVVDSVSKSFGSFDAVVDVSLDVGGGDTLALLGPSGCGKTTLLRIISGLEIPDKGRVVVGDRDLTPLKPETRRVGMVFQGGALFPHMTVAENVGYGLDGRSDRDQQVSDALAMMDLSGFEDRYPDTLSGGQAQRVALARAVAPEPDVLLLDEPFSSLDAELRIRVRSEVAELLRSLSITTVFVTHDQEDAFVVGDSVAVMREGRVLQTGTPAGLYQHPASAWIAAFVGEANLVEGTAAGSSVATKLGNIAIDGSLSGDCRVVLRPEHLSIASGDQGSVTSVEFYGHDTAYTVSIGGEQFAARRISAPAFAIGDTVSLTYDGPPAAAFPAS
jgi:iron(III) transport system ATP-binding protein